MLTRPNKLCMLKPIRFCPFPPRIFTVSAPNGCRLPRASKIPLVKTHHSVALNIPKNPIITVWVSRHPAVRVILAVALVLESTPALRELPREDKSCDLATRESYKRHPNDDSDPELHTKPNRIHASLHSLKANPHSQQSNTLFPWLTCPSSKLTARLLRCIVGIGKCGLPESWLSPIRPVVGKS